MKRERGSAMVETAVAVGFLFALCAATLYLGERAAVRQKLAAGSRFAAERAELPLGGHSGAGPRHGQPRGAVGTINKYLYATPPRLSQSDTRIDYETDRSFGTKARLESRAPVSGPARMLLGRDGVTVSESNRVLLRQIRDVQ